MTHKPTPEKKPLFAEVGDPVDLKATALEITPLEVQSVMVSEQTDAQKKEQLVGMKTELTERIKASDTGEDLQPILDDINNALESL